MGIMELGALGEFVGAIAVVFTFIYLAIQIKQNSAATDNNTAPRSFFTTGIADMIRCFNPSS